MRRTITSLIGTTALLAGFGLAAATPAQADTVGPRVTFDAGVHFVKASQLSDSSTSPSLNVSSKWRQSDADGICDESGFVHDVNTGATVANWSGVRTQVAFRAVPGSGCLGDVNATDCAFNTSDTSRFYTWNLARRTPPPTARAGSPGCAPAGRTGRSRRARGPGRPPASPPTPTTSR